MNVKELCIVFEFGLKHLQSKQVTGIKKSDWYHFTQINSFQKVHELRKNKQKMCELRNKNTQNRDEQH